MSARNRLIVMTGPAALLAVVCRSAPVSAGSEEPPPVPAVAPSADPLPASPPPLEDAASTLPEAAGPPAALASSLHRSGSEKERWERHLHGFRREHNFALTAGAEKGVWHVKSFGGLANQQFGSSGVYSRFQYTYHLPLYEGFGYLLGSSVGYLYETGDIRSGFRPVPAIQFPGVVAGLVLNINPFLRFAIAADVYLERYNNIQEMSATDAQGISITTNTYDGGAFLDVFYQLNWGVRLEAHYRHVDYQGPLRDPSNDQTYSVDSVLSKNDRWFGLGVVFHLL